MEQYKWLNEDRFKDITSNKSTFSLKFEGLLILENFLNLRTLFLLRSFLVDFRLMNITENAQRFFLFLFFFFSFHTFQTNKQSNLIFLNKFKIEIKDFTRTILPRDRGYADISQLLPHLNSTKKNPKEFLSLIHGYFKGLKKVFLTIFFFYPHF